MSSSISTPGKYDVFLSFRSEDVGNNFASHLYSALRQKKIKTYRPDHPDNLVTKEEISSGNTKAIDESNLSVIIFSKNYASSSRCLDELVHILECKGKGKPVVPVFYHVRQSNLSKQKVGDKTTFARNQERFRDNMDKWRRALEEARHLSGWSSFDIRPESRLVDEIIQDILKKLNHLSYSDQFLVGIDERIEKLESSLRIGSPDAIRIVGIFGPGGMGKTTLAQVAYNKLSSQFESCCFLSSVRDESNRLGLIELRNKLLAELLRKTNQDLSNPQSFGPNFFREKFHRQKVLIVLDDVNNSNQFKILTSEKDLFAHGSRIIITTRDLQMLKNIGADIYRIEELNYQEALQLFHSACFEKNSPPKNYSELSKKIVDYANGNPLALKILGSNLFNRSIETWEDMLTKLKEAPNVEVAKMLKMSYDALDSDQQNIFLDIACFFKGMKRDVVEEILDHSPIGDLIDKSLITVGPSNVVKMHDLVREMALEIARQESFVKPGNRSRLWCAEEIFNVLKGKTGTEAIKGISLDLSEIEDEVLDLDPTAFKKMSNLRLLKFYHSSASTPKKSGYNILHEFNYLPSTLRYLHWASYPLTSLPKTFSPENLVELDMRHSKLKKLWDGVLSLKKLKKIDLSHSSNLSQVPDLSRASSLVSINFQYCKSLSEVPSYFQSLNELTILNLNGCWSLHKFPELPPNIKELDLSETSIETVPSSIGCLSSLMTLRLGNCKRLEGLPESICKLKTLALLNMSGCSKLEYFPEILEPMEHLWFLSLSDTRIKILPSSIGNLIGLGALYLKSCENLEFVPENIYSLSKLETLIASNCVNLKALPFPGQSVNLRLNKLELSNCRISEVPDDLLILSSLESLDLSGNEIIEGIPTSIKQLSKLKHLNISNCKNLKFLPEIPLSLELVDAHGCESLKTVSSSKTVLSQGWDHLDAYSEKFVFVNCFKLDQNARHNLITDSQLRILRMATLSRNKSKHVLEYPSVSICYPGNRIPKWFSHQNEGSSIDIKLRPHWRNTNFLGFAFCIVAVPFAEYNFHPQIHFRCESIFRSKDGKKHPMKSFLRGYSQGNGDEEKTRIFLSSNHVFQWYDYGLNFHGLDDVFSTFTEASFEFYATDSSEGKVNSYKVKKCGIHMLYLQEVAKFDVIDPYLVGKSRGKEIRASCDDTDDSSECGSIEEIEEDEEEYVTVSHESEQNPDRNVDSNTREGDHKQPPKRIYNEELNSYGCLEFLSHITGCLKSLLPGKKSENNKGFGHGLRRNLSASPGTSSLPMAVAQHLQAMEKTINHMHSQITEMQNQTKRELDYFKRMRPRALPGLDQK